MDYLIVGCETKEANFNHETRSQGSKNLFPCPRFWYNSGFEFTAAGQLEKFEPKSILPTFNTVLKI